MTKFTFFDLETPNRQNDKICSFGLIHMVDGEIVFEKEFLVQPETYFDAFNVELHGVSARMVEQARTFDHIWEDIKPYFIDSIIVAHNATFDLTVLSKVLYYYQIEIPKLRYTCTWQMAKQRLKVPKYSLDALCRALDIPLENHHNAMEDTYACYGIFVKLYRWFEYLPTDVQTFIPKLDHRYVIKRESKEAKESFYNEWTHESVKGLLFCLSGNFKYGTKSDVANYLQALNANCHGSVTSEVDVLLVGNFGHEKWCGGTYGTKIQKALWMQAKGQPIQIIRETDFFNNIERSL